MVDEKKAQRWAKQLGDMLESDYCDETQASRMAGRLSFAVGASGGCVGRAFVKAFYAQASAPLRGFRLSFALRRSVRWFIYYLLLAEPCLKLCERRPRHVVAWSDAAGASRKVSAVVHCPVCGWMYTVWHPPDWMFDLLLRRGDHYIGYQELCGVVLIVFTFEAVIRNNALTSWQDNQGVLHTIIHGGGEAAECNAVIGNLWLTLSRWQVAFRLGRVESRANNADAPSRGCLEWLQERGAVFVEPRMPPWALSPWDDPLSAL